MDKYCEFFHLLLRPTLVLVLDVEVDRTGGVDVEVPLVGVRDVDDEVVIISC